MTETADRAPSEPDEDDVAALQAALETSLTDVWSPGTGDADAVWSTYRELGLFDVAGELERPGPVIAAILQSAARHLAPGPLVEEVFVRPWLTARHSAAGLGPAAPDDRLAVVDPAGTGDWRSVRGDVGLSGGVLRGEVRGIAHAPLATRLLVVGVENGCERLAAVAVPGPGLLLEETDGLDPGCRIGTVRFAGCPADILDVVPEALTDLRCWLRLFVAAELSGITDAVVDMTRTHCLQREQFGRPIAGFQAVRHVLADMATEATALRNLVRTTAGELDGLDRSECVESAAVAKAYAADTALRICERGLQLHGGIGFVEEHSLHHYFKGALRRHAYYGCPGELYSEIGAELLRDARWG